MTWWTRLKLRLRGSIATEGTATLPAPTGQHYEETEREKWAREHGFSAAFDPMPFSEDIAQHNAAVDREYAEEVERRKEGYTAGTYRPTVLVLTSDVPPERVQQIVMGQRPTADEINWHLDMSADPGRRTNVTTLERPAPPPREVLEAAREAGRLAAEVRLEEHRQGITAERPAILNRVVGSREDVLKRVGGNEAMADAVETYVLETMCDGETAGR